MGIFNGILLVSDLDGTLLHRMDSKISDANAEAIKNFMSEGGRFGFATGRLVSELGEYDRVINTNTLSICGNGTMLCDPRTGESHMIETCGGEVVPFLDKVMATFPDIMPEIDSSTTIHYIRPREVLERHKKITDAPFKEMKCFDDAEKPWCKIALWGMENAVDELIRDFPREDVPKGYALMKTYKHCAELVSETANKGTALAEYKKLFPEIKRLMAVGDHFNDVEMIRRADVGFAVANAIGEAKGAADVVLTRNCDNDAVAEAIEYIYRHLEM